MLRPFGLALAAFAVSCAVAAGAAADTAVPPGAPPAAPASGPAEAGAPASAEVRFGVSGIEVVVERDTPQACFTFTGPLGRLGGDGYVRYVVVEPAAAPGTVARDRTLCVEGLSHGRRYAITLKAGLPGTDGTRLEADAVFEIDVPNRAPGLAFDGSGHILPRIGAEGLPLRTINVARARLQVVRLTDPAAVERIYHGRVAQSLTEEEIGEIVREAGEVVWQGEMATGGQPNQAVTTPFPIDAALGGLEPGVYVAVADDAGAPKDGWAGAASKWFVVSDIGLATFLGTDGLTIFTRRVADAAPAAGMALRLIARDGSELARAATGEDGLARIGVEALKGGGVLAPQAIFATGPDGDFNVIELADPDADLADRFSAGLPATAFIRADRGIYRPGETAHVTALLRDADGRAMPGRKARFRLLRPDGLEILRREVEDAGNGGYAAALPLPASPFPGEWTAEVQVAAGDGDEYGDEPAGTARFLVEDFVPPRIEARIETGARFLTADGPVEVTVGGRHFYGRPTADVPGEAVLTIRPAGRAFPTYPDYRFGLVQEAFEPVTAELPGFRTDEAGRATLPVRFPEVPDTSLPLEAVVRATLLDFGGGTATSELVLPVRDRPFAIGIRPRFADNAVPEGTNAGFDVIAVSPDGAAIDRPGLSYELFEERHEPVWFETEGRWDYRTEIKDRRVSGGTLDAATEAPARIEVPVGSGRYRLEVFEPTSGVASSVRFTAGWWVSPSGLERPDEVEVTAMRPYYAPGETATVFVQPPYRARVAVTVADRSIRRTFTQEIGPEGAFLEIPLDAGWTGGVYVVATAFAPMDGQRQAAPRRATGHAWLGIDPKTKALGVSVEGPREVPARQPARLSVKVDGIEEGARAQVVVSAVDETVLRLTDYRTPDPVRRLAARRPPGIEVRDGFGRLLDLAGTSGMAAPAPLALRQVAGLPGRDRPVAALFSGILQVGPDGTVEVPLDIPDITGVLRIEAVAWTPGRIGRGQAALAVRDPVSATLSLPRLLAPGDRADIGLRLRNLSGAEADWTVRLAAEGAVSLADGDIALPGLAAGALTEEHRTLVASGPGTGRLRMTIEGPDGFSLRREWPVAVRSAAPAAANRTFGTLVPGELLRVPEGFTEGISPEGMALTLAVGALPDFDLPGLLLDGGPEVEAGAEALASAAMPMLRLGALAGALAGHDADALNRRTQARLDRLLALQRADGAFARWSPEGPAESWLTAYVLDVLMRAREAGFRIPEQPYEAGLGWLSGLVDRSWFEAQDLPARAYAQYVLARAGRGDIADIRYFYENRFADLPTGLARAHVAATLALLGDPALAAQAFAQAGGRTALPGLKDWGTELRDRAASLALMAESGAVEREKLAEAADGVTDLLAGKAMVLPQERAWLVRAGNALAPAGGPFRLQVDGQTMDREQPLNFRLDPAAPARIGNAGDTPIRFALSAHGAAASPPQGAPSGIVRRVYDMDGREVGLAELRTDDRLVVVLEGEAAEGEERQAVIADLPPAGFEVERVILGEGGRFGGLDWLGKLAQPVHAEVGEDRYLAAVALGPQNRSFRLAYLVRAAIAGDYALPAPILKDPAAPQRAVPAAERVLIRPR